MTTKSSKVLSVSLYAVVISCLTGYYFTQHNAFLFVYAFLNWIGLISLIISITVLWKVMQDGDSKQIEKVETALREIKEKMKFTYKTVLSYAFTFSSIGLLLYWQAFATATPVIIMVLIGFFLRYLVNGIFEDEQIEST